MPTPTLDLTIAGSAISENGGSTTGTVTRSGSTSSDLFVTLSSNDTGEASVPSTVIILNGQTSADFTINGVDDNLLDGTQTVTITATAAGFTNGSDTISVLNDDVPQDPDPEEEEPAPAFAQRFDFGTRTSPLEPGYTRVTASTSYNATLGYGWAGGAVRELDRGTGTGVTRDLHYRDVGTFVVDVPNGTYQVTLTVGDTGPYRHDQQIILEGVLVDSIATAARQVVTRTYAVTVSDGQLTLRLDGRGGTDPNMVISGLQVTGEATEPPMPTPTLDLTIAGSAISENGGSTTGTVTRSGSTSGDLFVTLSSNDTGEASVPSTVIILNGQTSADFTINGVDDNLLDGTQTVTITATAAGFTNGSDTISVLNDDVPQDPDPEEEEPAPAFAQRFDFGTRTSPLESGYTRVTASTSYNATLGYGWAGGAVRELDRGTGTGVTRDLHYRDVGTFAIDLPNGNYGVMLTVGDEGPYRHDQQIILEGTPVDAIATAAGEVVTRAYAVTVSDGQLQVRLDGRGGVDPNMVISGLHVIKIPPELGSATNIPTATLDNLFAALENNPDAWL